MPVLGLFLVFAALIAPALWRQSGASPTIAWLGSGVACGLGLAASWAFDVPKGTAAGRTRPPDPAAIP